VLAYIKHKLMHPFWSSQPVNSRLKFLNQKNGILNDELPNTKWLDLNHTIVVSDDVGDIYNTVCRFINDNGSIKCAKSDVQHYLTKHSYPVYLGIYKKHIQPTEIIESKIPEYDNIAGVITAVPMNFTIFKNNQATNIHNSKANLLNYLYYVDNLVVEPEYRKKKIPCKLITGLHYKVKEIQTPTLVGLFKRENDASPFFNRFTSYTSYWFNIEYWFKKSYALHPSVKCLKVSHQNLNLFYSFLVSSCGKYFNCFIYPDISNLIELVEANIYTIYCIMKGDTICAVYCFKRTDTDYILVNSVNANRLNDFFIHGFYYCLQELYNKTRLPNVRIEGLSDCKLISDYVLSINSNIRKSVTGWYLYNYKTERQDSQKTFILV
tara:strand:- start:69 stop:1205 length:1137 start_codon:yes stop_codon:yes gene_type:complete